MKETTAAKDDKIHSPQELAGQGVTTATITSVAASSHDVSLVVQWYRVAQGGRASTCKEAVGVVAATAIFTHHVALVVLFMMAGRDDSNDHIRHCLH